jgi:tRNA (cmo5U34)-methyltransferase
MGTANKSTVEEIRARFDRDVERFSDLATGQSATVDAVACMDLVARAAAATNPRARRALDVGCGAGNYSLKLVQRLPDVRVTLVDLSEPMLDRAKARLGASVDSVHSADIRDLDFGPGSFDIIVAAAVLHHLREPREWEQTFAKFHRWLSPGGGLWIFDLVAHEAAAVQELQWAGYGNYLETLGGAAYRERVFAYVEREDTPAPLTYQLDLLRRTGFGTVDVLHKNSCFAAFGAIKAN